MLLEVTHQFFRDGLRERLIGPLRALSRISQKAHLIQHLHHDDRVRLPVHFAEVSQKRAIGLGIRVQGCVVQDREHFHAVAALVRNTREPRLIFLQPDRRIT